MLTRQIINKMNRLDNKAAFNKQRFHFALPPRANIANILTTEYDEAHLARNTCNPYN